MRIQGQQHGSFRSMVLGVLTLAAVACGGQLDSDSDAGGDPASDPGAGAGGHATASPGTGGKTSPGTGAGSSSGTSTSPTTTVGPTSSEPDKFKAACVSMCDHIIGPCGGSTSLCVSECVARQPSTPKCAQAFDAFLSCMLSVKVECSAKSLITIEGCDEEREAVLTC